MWESIDKKLSYSYEGGIKEEPRKKIDRFFNSLDPDIRNRVELLPYNDLNELVQLCVKVEQQYAQYYTPSQPNGEFKREEYSSSRFKEP